MRFPARGTASAFAKGANVGRRPAFFDTGGTMRSILALGIAAALLAAIPARAQQDTVPQEIAEARLPADVAERVTTFFNDPRTLHFNGRTRIPADGTVSRPVAVLGRPFLVA